MLGGLIGKTKPHVVSQSSSSEIGSNSTGSQGDVLVVGDDVPVPLSEKLLGGKVQALADSSDGECW